MQNAAHRRDSRSSKAHSKKRRRKRTLKQICDVTKIVGLDPCGRSNVGTGWGKVEQDVGKKGHRYGQKGSFEYQNLAW